MDPNHKYWNQKQQELQRAFNQSRDHQKTIDLFLEQHAMVHSAKLAGSNLWSFEDEICQDLSESAARDIPPGCDHSIVWIFWHIARIEDITMNLLVAGSPQIFNTGDWKQKLKVDGCDTGNMMKPEDVSALSRAIDLEALR